MMSHPRGKRPGRRRTFRPVITRLEDRRVLATGVNIMSVLPNILIPPKGQYIPVLVQGYVTRSNTTETPLVRYQVVDQYHRYEPYGKVTAMKLVNPNEFRYAVTIPLLASRSTLNGPNAIGRQYSILVVSTDSQDSSSAYAGAIVPLNAHKPPKPVHKLPGI